ncbi:MAG: OmpA family protein [Planctomycetota bacterium]|nr:OmpA family protein [Planctomycetota bacterium]
MIASRRVLVLLSIAVLIVAAGGCKPRQPRTAGAGQGASIAEQEQRLQDSRTVAALRAENEQLKTQLAQAREELEKNRGGTVGAALGIGAADLGEGWTQVGANRVALGEDFAFEKGSATLNKEGKAALQRLALRLNEGDHANAMVVVEGHTDESPVSRPRTRELYVDNWGLSAARAAAVVRALQEAGVNPQRLRGSFRGQYAPVPGAKDKAAHRRVEIYLEK